MYLDLVLCANESWSKCRLFKAPAYSNLERGDEVTVETNDGEQQAIVVESVTVHDTDDVVNFIYEIICASLPLYKVKSKIYHQYFEYGDEEEQ